MEKENYFGAKILSLQERKKWRKEKERVRVGQLFLLKNENFPPAQWEIGQIKESITSCVEYGKMRTFRSLSVLNN